jgi:glycerophosphoryl diester phosphodiesterase
LNLDIDFLYYFTEGELQALVDKFKSNGYFIKVYMTGTFAPQEGPDMYQKMVNVGVEVITTDHPQQVYLFNNR